MEDLEPEPGRVRQMESRRHRQQREHQRHKSGKVAAPFHLWFFLYEVESAPIAIQLKLHFASFQNLKEPIVTDWPKRFSLQTTDNQCLPSFTIQSFCRSSNEFSQFAKNRPFFEVETQHRVSKNKRTNAAK